MESNISIPISETFKVLIHDWQQAVYEQGESGQTLHTLARTLRWWLGESVSAHDLTEPLIVLLVPERLSNRITQMALEGHVSEPYMMLAVLASIGQIVQAVGTVESDRAATLWVQYTSERMPPRLWMASFDHSEPKRSSRTP